MADEKDAAALAATAKAEAEKAAAAKAAEASKVVPGTFEFSGTVGYPFAIYGSGFGDGGSVVIGGERATLTLWGDNKIKGTVPVEVKPGKVKVVVNGKSIDATV